MSAGHYQLLGEVGFLYLIPNFLRMKEAHRSGADKLQRLTTPHPRGAHSFLRLSRFHTGVWAGEWLVVTRYASWEVYGKVQERVAKDPDFAQLVGKYSYHFPTDGPQHRRRRRSLTTAQRNGPSAGDGTEAVVLCAGCGSGTTYKIRGCSRAGLFVSGLI